MKQQIIPKYKDYKPVFQVENTNAIMTEDHSNPNWQEELRIQNFSPQPDFQTINQLQRRESENLQRVSPHIS